MSTKFFNNKDNTLFDKFCGIARNMANFDIFRAVVGYFRSSGYFKLRTEFERVSKIQILVGINIDSLFKKQSKYLERKAFNADEVKRIYTEDFVQEVKDCAYDEETERGILQLCQDIMDGRVEMRIDRGKNLHAKFYLMLPDGYNENKDGWVIMGSSNISEQGLGITDPPRYELNVAMKDYDDVTYCNDEFEKLWNDAVPLTLDDVQKAKQQTHLADEPPTPYEIYMKVLIGTFGMQVEDDFSLQLPDGVADLRYQHDAAIQGYQMLLQHNGFFLADVVGLGKTIIATMIAKRFIEANGRYTRILVVFPPAVRQNWEDTFKLFRIKNANAQFVSSGSLFKVINQSEGYWGREEYDLIIVDEAHNFRHDGTDSFADLQNICKAPRINRGKVPGRKKVMLLSATPLNNRPSDFLAQIQLFQDTRNSTIEGVRDLTEIFAPWTKEYDSIMFERKSPEANAAELTRRVDALYAEIRQKVLSKIMVRRTRTNILHVPSYREDLEQQGKRFPTMLDPQEELYEMSHKLKRLFYDTLDILTDVPSEDNPKGEGLYYARYRGPEFFVDSDVQTQHSAQLLMGIYRTHLVKRLESSFYAFKRSLHTFLKVTNSMIDMFKQGKVIIVSDVKVGELQERGMDLDDIIEYIVEHRDKAVEEFTYSPDKFRPQFLEMLKADSMKLRELCENWDRVDEDPKFDLFVELLEGELFDSRNLEKKLVVFSESVDTITYLEKELRNRLGRNDILRVDSSNRNHLSKLIRDNFDANIGDEDKRDDYNIIITSDVLAEGVNLHRSNVVVNYDSPWNASRLMQRNGRVNRIGTRAEYIYNYMFYPSRQGNEEIQLYENALIKLQGFQSALGEDSKVYSHEEIVREFQLFNADVQDDTDRVLALLEEARRLYQTNRDLYNKIKNLPAKSRTIRQYIPALTDEGSESSNPQISQSSSPIPYTVAFLAMPRKTEYFLVTEQGAKSISFLDATDILRADPSEKPLRLEDALDVHYTQVRKAMDSFKKSVAKVEDTHVVHGRPVVPSNSEALKVLKEIKVEAAEDENTELVEQCSTLIGYVQQGTYNQIEDALRSTSRKCKKLPPDEKRQILTDKIVELYNAYHLDITQNDSETDIEEEFNTVGLIVSETVVNPK